MERISAVEFRDRPGIASVPIFYINRDKDRERRSCIEGQLAAACAWAERVPAIEGNDVPGELSKYFFHDGQAISRLSPGEVGCYASHLRAAQTVVARGLSCGLVLEDDAIVPTLLNIDLAEILDNAPFGWDVIHLSNNPSHAYRPLVKLSRQREIVCYSRIPANMVGYLISASGAMKLLSPGVREWPIDTDLRQPWQFDLQIFGIVPKLISHNDALASAVLEYGERSRLRRGLRKPTLKYPLGNPLHTPWGAWFNLRRLGLGWWGRCSLENLSRRLLPSKLSRA